MSYMKPEPITVDMIGDKPVRKISVRQLCDIKTDELYAADFYFACDSGDIMNQVDFLQQVLEGDYLQVTICDGYGNSKTIDVHRIIALAFCPKTKERNEVHHINGDKQDNNSRNLLWVTRSEHVRLHSLLDTDRKAYSAMVKEIKRDNRKRGKVQ